jgi:LytR cell envelope-related transcriptional attenuator
MSRTPGSSNGDVARGASFAAAKGALLIGLAVVIGIVLLQQVDAGTKRPVGAATTTTKPKTKPKTTTTAPSVGATTTTVASAPTKSPAQLRIIVLNGGAASGLAAQMATHLKQQGYTSQPQDANNWTGHHQQGNSVLCKPAFPREARALSLAVGQGATVGTYPSTAPTVIQSEVDCIVVVGG